jgi:signal peptidase I
MAKNKTVAEEALKEDAAGKSKVEKGEKRKAYIRDTVEAVVIALVLALIIRTFFVQAFKIPSSSMEDTLLIGDHILVSKSSYGFQLPKPAMIKVFGLTVPFFETELKPLWGEIKGGDIVVFRFPGDRSKDYIKRVIGVGGDEIEIKSRKIYVNNELMDDTYAAFKGKMRGGPGRSNDFGSYVVPPGHIFVMGDNRDRSYDSRYWGPVNIKDVKGRAFIIYWSRDSKRSWPAGIRFSRFAKKIR